MSVVVREPMATAATLTRWLAEVGGLTAPMVEDVSVPQATGWSNETIMFDASWVEAEGGARRSRRLVARVAPSGHRVFPDDTFVRQHAVMHALAERTEVPMARVRWLEQDPAWFGQPFWIMDRVDGVVPGDVPPYASTGWLHDAGPDAQRRVWWSGIDAMAALHRVDVAALGVPNDVLPAADDTLAAHLDHYERFLDWAEDGRPHALARRALDGLRRDRPPEPAEGPALVWGDARLSNLVYRDHRVVAVLDWEMCAVGDPLQDLGYWLFADRALTAGAGCGRLRGFPSRGETVARWAAATGRSVAAVAWFERFAGFRFTVIMLRMGKLLAGLGLVPDSFAEDNLISQGLERELDGT